MKNIENDGRGYFIRGKFEQKSLVGIFLCPLRKIFKILDDDFTIQVGSNYFNDFAEDY